MGHVSLKAIALVVRQHNIGASTVMTLTAEEKAFLRVAVVVIPRVASLFWHLHPMIKRARCFLRRVWQSSGPQVCLCLGRRGFP